ncbi:hypothetical protein, partial [Streptomyces sp. NPDC014995]|uniref:hypothetical protein n=1 Tax=Streptomyces sp. NPDC014995 TaxID=3364936 RepID=UPI0036F9D42C
MNSDMWWSTAERRSATGERDAPDEGEALYCGLAGDLEVLTKALDVSVGDQAGGEAEEGLVDVVAAF